MKTKSYFLWIMMIFAATLISCSEEDKESCDSEDLAEDFGCPVNIDAIATFCSDGVSNSYYTYNGNDYLCAGVDAATCDAALNQIGVALIEAGCSSKKSGSEAGFIKLTSMAETLLEEVRTKSLCE